MDALRQKAQALLDSGDVKVVIGYGPGSSSERTQALFARTGKDAQKLIWNEHCRQNLATYLLKPEVKKLGKPAIVAGKSTLRAILQLAVENQIVDGTVVALAVPDPGENRSGEISSDKRPSYEFREANEIRELATLAAVEEYLATLPRGLAPAEQAELDRFSSTPLEQRWTFWHDEMARCIKCYACRAVCPMCYCTRCITDANQPQWIPVASTTFGNIEWNVARAMHLAGRCVDCGSCRDACPAGIRLDLLNHVLAHEALTQFGAEAGASVRKDYALAAFKPDDKETFIR